jgi:hypothetical protein
VSNATGVTTNALTGLHFFAQQPRGQQFKGTPKNAT